MATAAGSASQEYWRPSNPEVARVVTSIRGRCRRCGSDFAVGAHYCHACGDAREPRRGDMFLATETLQDQESTRTPANIFGLSIPSAVFLAMGVICVVTAALLSLIYREDTLVDWQAVQLWRIEWLLAAVASLLAGILLKKGKDQRSR